MKSQNLDRLVARIKDLLRFRTFRRLGISSVLARCGWFSIDDQSRAYYGVKIGPFLFLFSKWKKSKEVL